MENIFAVCHRRIRITEALKVSAVTSRAPHLAALHAGWRAGGEEEQDEKEGRYKRSGAVEVTLEVPIDRRV